MKAAPLRFFWTRPTEKITEISVTVFANCKTEIKKDCVGCKSKKKKMSRKILLRKLVNGCTTSIFAPDANKITWELTFARTMVCDLKNKKDCSESQSLKKKRLQKNKLVMVRPRKQNNKTYFIKDGACINVAERNNSIKIQLRCYEIVRASGEQLRSGCPTTG